MRKNKIIAGFEIFLLIGMSFAIAFVLSENVGVVRAAPPVYPPPTTQTPASWSLANELEASRAAGTYKLPASGGGGTGAGGAGGGGGTGATGLQGLFSGSTFGTAGVGGVVSSLLSGAIWGAIVGGGAYLLATLFGLDKEQAKSIGLAAGGGAFAGTTVYFLGQHGTLGATIGANAGLWGLGIGAGVGVAILLVTYKKTKQELLKFECLPWEAPLGGSDCEKCNNEKMPCSEYRCKSLGQACEIVNKGTENELCVWVGKGDVQAPKITPWDAVLKPSGMRYIPDTAISPPNRGFKIVKPQGRGCLEAFTNLQFGIQTDEPAQCKIDYQPKDTYDEMEFLFGETNMFSYNHTQRLKVPNPFAENGTAGVPEIAPDGTYTLYARCIDANGNGKDSAFVAFSFCVNPGPDTIPPEIVGSSILSGRAVQFDVDSVPIEIYTNEPAECKWSKEDKAYEAMQNTMQCSRESFQVNSELNYVCSSELTGIVNQQNNDFYFRCKDQPKKPERDRNVMTTSFKLTLRGTEKLIVKNPGPSGILQGGQSVVNVNLSVETGHGADDGSAICYFYNSAAGEFNIAMDNTGDVKHSQSLFLVEGNYRYFFRCIDSGGNSAETNTSFVIEVDREEPLIARVFKDGDRLKIITNEEAKCAYSLTSCDYNLNEASETVFLYEDPTKRVVHYAPWNSLMTYYVKCADLTGREPAPDACSIIVRGSELN